MVRFQVVRWLKSTLPCVKLNTDACVAVGGAASGVLVRDSEGDLVFAFYKEFGEVDMLTAEALSLQVGLTHCQARGVQQLTVEVDNRSLVRLVSSDVLAK